MRRIIAGYAQSAADDFFIKAGDARERSPGSARIKLLSELALIVALRTTNARKLIIAGNNVG